MYIKWLKNMKKKKCCKFLNNMYIHFLKKKTKMCLFFWFFLFTTLPFFKNNCNAIIFLGLCFKQSDYIHHLDINI